MRKRVALWDNIRFFLITMVVIGHFADEFTHQSDAYKSIFLFIYAFHMPLFIFISGHLHKNNKILEKCFFYVSAGFLLKIVLTISFWCTGQEPSFSLLSDASLPWFLFALAFYTCITYVLRERHKGFVLFLSVLVACFVGFDSSVTDYLYISRIVIFFPFYWAGTMIETDTILQLKKKKIIVMSAIAIILAWALICFFQLDRIYMLRYLFTGRNAFWPEIRGFGPFARLVTYVLSAIISFTVILICPSKNIKWVSKMGTRSIDVYVWHTPVFLVVDNVMHFSRLFSFGIIGKIAY